jgi:hypothetical protein
VLPAKPVLRSRIATGDPASGYDHAADHLLPDAHPER